MSYLHLINALSVIPIAQSHWWTQMPKGPSTKVKVPAHSLWPSSKWLCKALHSIQRVSNIIYAKTETPDIAVLSLDAEKSNIIS